MENKFDRSHYPRQEPENLVIGDRWVWRRDDIATVYSPDDYSLSYEFNIVDGSTSVNFTLSATEADSNYFIEIPSTTTTNYSAGNYHWFCYITRSSDSERLVLDEGYSKLIENYATTSSDVRSHAKVVLDAIEAVIENRATIDQSSMSIAGRSLTRLTIDELLTLRDRYKAEHLRELRKSRVRNKQSSGAEIRVRFGTHDDLKNITDLSK